jgi:hypothetical protein
VPRLTSVPRDQIETLARFQQVRVLASPETADASSTSALWCVEVDRLSIKHADIGLGAALAGLAGAVRAELPEILYGKLPPSEEEIALGVQLEIADGLGRLEPFLRETTETRGWDFELDPQPKPWRALAWGPAWNPVSEAG